MNLPFGIDAVRGIDALVVNTTQRGPRQMLGMSGGMGDNVLTEIADKLTGGQVSAAQQQLDRLELALKVSIAASCIAGLAGLAVLLSGKR